MRMSGGGPGLYRRGGASDSTNLDAVIGFDEQQLLVNHCHQLLVTVKTMILQLSLSMFIVSELLHSTTKRSHLGTSCHVMSGRSLGLGPARRGEASARTCGSPTSSYRLHKWCTQGPPFKSVEILLKSRYGIKQLIP